jgi:hypothetical protein
MHPAKVDVDKNEEGARLLGETKVQAVKNLRSNKFCKDVGIPGVPTFLIDSGNGLQALWRLAERLLSISGEDALGHRLISSQPDSD